jgi:hypothetical protein
MTRDPDYLYDPDDWEVTYEWEMREQAAEDCEVVFSGPKLFNTLIKGPDIWCAVINSRTIWFRSKDEAHRAWQLELARLNKEDEE